MVMFVTRAQFDSLSRARVELSSSVWSSALSSSTRARELGMSTSSEGSANKAPPARPRSAYDGGRPPQNEKWGTIVETNRGLGHQKRSKDDVDALVERLSATSETKVPESNRTGALKQSGIMNSYAWRGY